MPDGILYCVTLEAAASNHFSDSSDLSRYLKERKRILELSVSAEMVQTAYLGYGPFQVVFIHL